jgi:chemotaxis protein MotB
MGRKKHHEEEHENHERWLITYADMITLLMVLFIVLFSMSRLDLAKYEKLKASLSGGFNGPVDGGGPGGRSAASGGVLEDGGSWIDSSGGSSGVLDGGLGMGDAGTGVIATTTTAPTAGTASGTTLTSAEQAYVADREALGGVQHAIEEQLAALHLLDKVAYRLEERGLVVVIVTDQVLFDSGSAALRSQGLLVLDALVPVLASVPNEIKVEGHTDNVPISSSRFGSNWELSTARATNVLRYLTEAKGLTMTRFEAAGLGETHPIADNASPAGRAANRRVEIVVKAIVVNPNGSTDPTLPNLIPFTTTDTTH